MDNTTTHGQHYNSWTTLQLMDNTAPDIHRTRNLQINVSTSIAAELTANIMIGTNFHAVNKHVLLSKSTVFQNIKLNLNTFLPQ